jgi:hypothetical protein
MPQIERKMEVCDFCYTQHKQYMKDQQFMFAQKEIVAKCTCCGDAMCLPCHQHSLQEIKWSILAQYGFSICRQCIVNYRRVTDLQERLEEMLLKHVEQTKKGMKQRFYLYKQKAQWQLS